MTKTRPCVLSIAGFDPSGGAGVLADVKTCEANKVTGFAAVTGLTFQNESAFIGVKWTETEEIKKQIDLLLKKYKIEFIKIGLVRDMDMFEQIIAYCQLSIANCQLIWDPILKASAGFQIHNTINKEKVLGICKKIFLITPNMDEVQALTREQDPMKAAKELSQYCNVFLKGGHSEKNKGRDHLFTKEGKTYPFRAKKIAEAGKHGSGCVLSSAITASLAKGNMLQRACLEGKNYVTRFLTSNKTLLGYHRV